LQELGHYFQAHHYLYGCNQEDSKCLNSHCLGLAFHLGFYFLGDPRPSLAKLLTIDYSIERKRIKKIFKEHEVISPQDLK